MMVDENKDYFLKNTFWSFLTQSLAVVISLITNIILARLLTPFEFGQVGIILFFVTVITVLTEGGLGGALVRTPDISHEYYGTVFIFNFVISLICYLLLITSSGVISNFYHDPKLRLLICVSGLIIIVNSFNIVQNAKVYREMMFKKNLYINICSVLLSSVIGIVLATLGYKVWALVWMNLLSVLIRTILLWVTVGGIGSCTFNKYIFKRMFRFGIFVTLVSFLNNAFDNIYQLLLGKFFSIRQVGYLYQGKKIQSVPFSVLNSLTLGVIFSQLSKFQNNHKLFQIEYLRVFSVFTLLIGALASLVFLLARDIVQITLGNIWLESVLYIKLLTVASFFLLLKVFCQNICKVFDYTEKIFVWELFAVIFQILTIVIGIALKSIFITLSGAIVSNLIAYIVNSVYSWKLLKLNSKKELTILIKVMGSSFLGLIITSLLEQFNFNIFLHSLLASCTFILIYLFLLKLLKIFDYKLILNFI